MSAGFPGAGEAGRGAASEAQPTQIGPTRRRTRPLRSVPGGEAPEDVFNFTLILGLAPIFPGGAQQFSVLSDTIVFNQDGTWTAEGTLVPNAGSFNIGSVTAENILGVEATAIDASTTFTKLGSTLLIPEPTTVALLLAGLGPLVLRRRRCSS